MDNRESAHDVSFAPGNSPTALNDRAIFNNLVVHGTLHFALSKRGEGCGI